MSFSTYQKFKTKEELQATTAILEKENISYEIEILSAPVDVTFSHGTDGIEDKYALKIQEQDFEKVNEILDEITFEHLPELSEDDYLLEFSSEELIDILKNYNEWSRTDYLQALQLLKAKGLEFTEGELNFFKEEKIKQLKQPEQGDKAIITAGFILSILGGLFGIFIGYHYQHFKKTIITGEKVPAYNIKTQKQGKNMFYLGIISLVVWTVFLSVINF